MYWAHMSDYEGVINMCQYMFGHLKDFYVYDWISLELHTHMYKCMHVFVRYMHVHMIKMYQHTHICMYPNVCMCSCMHTHGWVSLEVYACNYMCL